MNQLEFWILNENFESVFLIDSAESLLWTERFCGYGDFEIYAMIDADLFEHTQQDYYAWMNGSDRLMIIDTRNIQSDALKGTHLKVTGVSLEHILTRRIVWNQTRLAGSLEPQIRKLLNQSIISPSDSNRRIPNFRFVESGDPAIQALSIDKTYTGDVVYDIVNDLCLEFGIGWKVVFNDELKTFDFSFYSPVDRSYSQTTNPYVVFSPSFDNIISSNYYESKRDYKTVALVAGEDTGVGTARKTRTVNVAPALTGLHRREMFVDARDLQSEREDGSVMTEAEYNSLLDDRGRKYLDDYTDLALFEGQVEATQTFAYGVDFFLGDIVQVRNEYGTEAKSRIDEIIFAETGEGRSMVPTFSMV